MKLIFKYLKPYFLLVLLIIGFTYAQVQTELALPDYMSDIVTNGIQYGGIKEDVPKALVDSDMNQIMCFVDAQNKNFVKNSFDLYKTNDYLIDFQKSY